MSRIKNFLEFLFVGPLFSIFQLFTTIRSDIVSVQETINEIASRLSSVSAQLSKGLDEVRGKISDLEAQAAAGEVVDFSAVNAALDAVTNQAQSLDDVVPDAISEEVPSDYSGDESVEVVSEVSDENV